MDDILLILINVAIGLAVIYVLFVVAEILAISNRKKEEKKKEYLVSRIRVPKDNELSPMVSEQLFLTIHAIGKKIGYFDRLSGVSQEKISFEIANTDRQIFFYVRYPKKLKGLVEGQIYAQYPNAEMSLCDDYTVNSSGDPNKEELFNNAIGAELKFSKPDIYPIKRYSQFKDASSKYPIDPLAAITTTISKFNQVDEQAWIQIIVSPLEEKWRSVFMNCIKNINKGLHARFPKLQNSYIYNFISRDTLKRVMFFPYYWFLSFEGKITPANDKVAKVEAQNYLNHDKETKGTASVDKVSKVLYESEIRIVYLPKENVPEVSAIKLREICGAFKQFNIPHLNGFEIGKITNGKSVVESYRNRTFSSTLILNVEELATLYHFPNITVNTPNIAWVRSRKLEPPTDLPTSQNCKEDEFTILAKTNFRGYDQVFGIKTADRRRHIYIIGKTGMGKSTLLENMIYSDIMSGKGLAVVDPHGDLAEAILDFVPSYRTNDVIVFDPSDREYPLAFNMLENVDPALNTIVCSGLVGIFKKIYANSWGPRLEHILRNTILSLLEYPNTTMLGIPRLLQDKDFRAKVIRKISDPVVKSFWINEFEKMDPKNRVDVISPILNKVGQFLSSPIIRNILGQPKSSLDIRWAMDHKKIVVVNLSKGKIGEDNSSLLGAMMITKFQLDAMSRANIPEKDRVDFYLYVDEFQNFATDSFATILSEARKYKLNLTMANQYIAQMPDEVRDAVFGNVGTIVSFQVGFDDADVLSNQFGEEATPNDLVSMSKYTAYSRLLIDGMPSKTFSMATLPPTRSMVEEGRRDKVIKLSRERYATKREIVEDKIRRWSEGASINEGVVDESASDTKEVKK